MYLIIMSLMLVHQSPAAFCVCVLICDYTNKKCEKSMFLMSVAESEVVSVVHELSFLKSTDYFSLNMEIFKHVIPNIAKPLCYISKKSSWMVHFQIRLKLPKSYQYASQVI